jgi:hypothetical protein
MRRPHDLPRSAPLLAALLTVLPALPACDGCHASKPYTPYTLSDPPRATASAPAADDTGSPAGGDAGPAFATAAASAAPGDGKTWPLEGGATEAPAGHAFVEGLVFDADGDQKPDLIAWARSPDGLRGEIWFAPGKIPDAGRAVAAIPADVALPGCNPTATLTRIGAGVVVFDLDPRCSARARGHASRWIAVLRLVPGGAPELGLEIRLGAPAEGETLAVAFDGRDRDGDGRGDVTATITLSGAPRPCPAGGEARAVLAFFDRPAGLSRDPSEPEASLKALAAGIVADGRKKTTAARVPASAAAARRMVALLCEEAGKPAITTSAGAVRCGDVRLADDVTMAEVEAALNLGDPFAAEAALARVEGHRKDLDALVAKSIPSIAGKLLRATAAAPSPELGPAFGPIAFNTSGDVLVRTKGRVIRVDRTSFDEAPIDAALRWPVRLAAPFDAPVWTLAGIEERCDAPTLVARFEVGGEPTEVPLPIPTPLRCAGAAHVPADFLGASPEGELIAVRGEILAVPREAPPRPALAEGLGLAPGAVAPLGAPRSPNGAVIAFTTPRGVLVATLKGQGRAASARIWTSPALDGASACVPNDAGDRIACVVKGAVAIYDAG